LSSAPARLEKLGKTCREDKTRFESKCEKVLFKPYSLEPATPHSSSNNKSDQKRKTVRDQDFPLRLKIECHKKKGFSMKV
jgi:hypothetical protein